MAEIKEVLESADAKKAIDLFTQNPYWKECYETAPSEACKDRIALSFYYSLHLDKFDKELRQRESEQKDKKEVELKKIAAQRQKTSNSK